MGLKNNPREHEDAIYATILADGKIHVSVAEGTEGAVLREYETSAGKKGQKWEHQYTEVSGYIKKLAFKEGDYGLNILVTIGDEDDEKPIVLALDTGSNFGEDIMKKLRNINMKKMVTIAPYAFEDAGKKKKGVTITQEGKKGESEKIANFYYDAEEKKVMNGYPVPPKAPKGGKAISKIQWRKYFEEARDFMIDDIKEHFKLEEQKDGVQGRDFKDFQ